MELVPGQTLAERLHSGRMPLDETLRVCRQLAEALGAAHQRGIAHRDIKPANIKLTPDGRVKILDFGLAKSADEAKTLVSVEEAPTMAVTSPGMVLGTPAYMSPEQVRGEPGGTRSDLWAFGCVLFELLAARRAFAAPTMAETIAAVLMTDPDWHALPTRHAQRGARSPAPLPRQGSAAARAGREGDPRRARSRTSEKVPRPRRTGPRADDSFARRAAVHQHQRRSADGLSRRRHHRESDPRLIASAASSR